METYNLMDSIFLISNVSEFSSYCIPVLFFLLLLLLHLYFAGNTFLILSFSVKLNLKWPHCIIILIFLLTSLYADYAPNFVIIRLSLPFILIGLSFSYPFSFLFIEKYVFYSLLTLLCYPGPYVKLGTLLLFQGLHCHRKQSLVRPTKGFDSSHSLICYIRRRRKETI